MGDGAQYTEQIIFKLVDETSGTMDRIVERARRSTDTLKKLALEVAANQKRAAEEVAREELEIAKALHRYRQEGAREETRVLKELHRFRQENIRAEESAAKQRLAVEQSVHSRIIQMQMEERKARLDTMAVSGGAGVSLGQGLRVGAGLAGATGNFQLAAGVYALERVTDMAGFADTKIAALGATAAAAGVSIVGVAAAIGSMVAGDAFTRALADMSTLLLDASVQAIGFQQALENTSQSALHLSSTFNVDLIDVVKGFKEALSSGIEAADLERFGNSVGEMSKALGIGFSDASNILTSFRDAYQLTISDLGRVNDVLFNIINLGKVNAEELQSNLGRVLPLAQAAGISIEDLGAAIAALTRRGATASQAVTSIADVINKLQNPAKGTAKLMDELGIAYGKAAIEGKHFSEIFGNIVEKTAGDADLISRLFPDIRGKRGVASLVEGAELLKEIEAGITASGTSAIAAQRAMDTYGEHFAQSWKLVTNAIVSFGSELGQRLLPLFKELHEVSAFWFGESDEARGDKIWADGAREAAEKMQAIKDKIVAANADIAGSYLKIAEAKEAASMDLQEKNNERKLNDFATSGEKTTIKELENQINDLSASLDKAYAKVNRQAAIDAKEMAKTLGIPMLEARLNSATDALDISQIKQQLEKAHAELKKVVEGWVYEDELDISVSEAGSLKRHLESTLDGLKKNIQERTEKPSSATKEDMEAFMHSIGLPTMQELEGQVNKIEAYKQSFKDRSLAIAKELYEADQKAHKAFEEKKQKDIDKTLDKLEKARNRTEQILNRIRDESMDAEMRRHGDDPRKQRNIAQGQFDAGVSELESGLKAGNISQKVFESLLDMIDRASKAKEGAMGAEDAQRAARGRGEDLEVIRTLVTEFMKLQEASAAKDLANTKAQKYSKLSQADAAKRGMAEAEAETQQNIKLDAKIDVNLKSPLIATPEEKAAITKVVVECLQTALKQNNTYSPYHQEKR